jgi:hypothetical protein
MKSRLLKVCPPQFENCAAPLPANKGEAGEPTRTSRSASVASATGGQCRQPVVIALRPTELDDEIATFDPAEIATSGAKRRNATCVTRRGHQTEEADTSDVRRLRPRRKRPCRSAAEQRDELASLHCVPNYAKIGSQLRPSKQERTSNETSGRCGNVRRSNSERPRSGWGQQRLLALRLH